MGPEVEAAVIAGIVGLITVLATVAAQLYLGSKTSKEQREELTTTLAQQRDQTLNERFATAADQLGSDKPPAVRLAGVYAMAGLADDWEKNRQTCVEVLCAYLRLPYEPDPSEAEALTKADLKEVEAAAAKRFEYQASREVRHTIIRVIASHLRPSAPKSWQGLTFDFTGVAFDGGEFHDAVFNAGHVSFVGATFSGGEVSFARATFSGGEVSFARATFSGGEVSFRGSKFTDGPVSFRDARFTGSKVEFTEAHFDGSQVSFIGAKLIKGQVNFIRANFTKGEVGFDLAEFIGGEISFRGAIFADGRVSFRGAQFTSGEVKFTGAKFTGSQVSYDDAQFTGAQVGFGLAAFSGSLVSFHKAKFIDGVVDFHKPAEWSKPPEFDLVLPLPKVVRLPPDSAAPST